MGMTIDEIIANETKEAEWFQRVANEDISSEQYEELKIFREKRADYHNQIANILRKYQKLEEYMKKLEKNGQYGTLRKLKIALGEVEDGKS